jgi:protocatechuate 3,4-dioxygenase beta subunit
VDYSDYRRARAGAGAPLLEPTPADIEGPFYKAGAPRRFDLSEGLPGSFWLACYLWDVAGAPLPGAALDMWLADPAGRYDNGGFRHRGVNDAYPLTLNGVLLGCRANFRVARPGCYDISEPGAPDPHEFRCPHLHVKVRAAGFKALTTQLYFADGEHNATDRWFDPRRCVRFGPGEGRDVDGRFDFVLERE